MLLHLPTFPATPRTVTPPLTLLAPHGMKKYSKMLLPTSTSSAPHPKTAQRRQPTSLRPIVSRRRLTLCCTVSVKAHWKGIFHSQVWINRNSSLTKISNKNDHSLLPKSKHLPRFLLTRVKIPRLNKSPIILFSVWLLKSAISSTASPALIATLSSRANSTSPMKLILQRCTNPSPFYLCPPVLTWEISRNQNETSFNRLNRWPTTKLVAEWFNSSWRTSKQLLLTLSTPSWTLFNSLLRMRWPTSSVTTYARKSLKSVRRGISA